MEYITHQIANMLKVKEEERGRLAETWSENKDGATKEGKRG